MSLSHPPALRGLRQRSVWVQEHFGNAAEGRRLIGKTGLRFLAVPIFRLRIRSAVARRAVGPLSQGGGRRRAKADLPAFFPKHHIRIAGIHLRGLSDRPGDNPGLGRFDLYAMALAIRKAKWNSWLVVEENAAGKSGDDTVRPAW